jgi:cell volume regulation protein A
MSLIGLAFIFIAGISFLGFAINALFDKIKITSVLPLMIIGLLIGPVFGLVNVGPNSIITELNPYITAIAIAFVLFDIGMNMRIKTLSKVILASTQFVLLTQVIIGASVGIFVHYIMGWSWPIALIFSFAVSGPSSITAPTLAKNMKAPENLRTFIVYEGVFSDILELVVPLVLISIYVLPNVAIATAPGPSIFYQLMGAASLGVVSALFWLYILNRFPEASKNYSWMLTIAMVIATYGISAQLGINTAIAVFIFGIVFANIGSINKAKEGEEESFVQKYFSVNDYVDHTREYQREIVFFVSTFFFVYIGLLFSLSQITLNMVGLGIAVTALVILSRIIAMPILSKVFSKDPETQKIERGVAYFNIARGLSPAIIAIYILTSGVYVQGFTDSIFMVILITNLIFTAGVFISYKPILEAPAAEKAAAK